MDLSREELHALARLAFERAALLSGYFALEDIENTIRHARRGLDLIEAAKALQSQNAERAVELLRKALG